MIKSIMTKYQKEGLMSVLNAIYRRLRPIRVKSNNLIKEIVSSGIGIEIGGVSSIFKKKNIIPIYPIINSLDNCNFSNNTVWEGKINEGLRYFYDENHASGRQYVLEATDLYKIQIVLFSTQNNHVCSYFSFTEAVTSDEKVEK